VRAASRFDAVLDAYSTWLASEDFYWASPLDGHDREVVDAVALVLARTPAVVVEARKLFATAQRPPQGWGFDLDVWFKTVPRVAHVLIVIAAAAAGALNGGSALEAADLMDLAWSELDLLLRASPMSGSDGHAASLTSGRTLAAFSCSPNRV
jgi:hypothetical protein